MMNNKLFPYPSKIVLKKSEDLNKVYNSFFLKFTIYGIEPLYPNTRIDSLINLIEDSKNKDRILNELYNAQEAKREKFFQKNKKKDIVNIDNTNKEDFFKSLLLTITEIQDIIERMEFQDTQLILENLNLLLIERKKLITKKKN